MLIHDEQKKIHLSNWSLNTFHFNFKCFKRLDKKYSILEFKTLLLFKNRLLSLVSGLVYLWIFSMTESMHKLKQKNLKKT